MINKHLNKPFLIAILVSIHCMALECNTKPKQTFCDSKVITITNENFSDEIKTEKIVLIYFFANWCKYCTDFYPTVEEIANEQDYVVGKLNVDSAPEIFNKYRDQYIPMIVVFKNGEMIDKIVGTTSKKDILDRIKLFQ